MKLASEIRNLFPTLQIGTNRLLSDYTTFRLGGPCSLFIDDPSTEQLKEIVQRHHCANIPVLVIGQGSNLIVSDSGLDCTVIRFYSEESQIEADGNRVTVSGNTLLDKLVAFSIEKPVGDLSFCSGIPGTVGGGIAGNAGAFGRQLGDHLIEAELLDKCGKTRIASKEELAFSYRYSLLKETGDIVLSATFELPAADPAMMQAERNRIMEFRRDHHPDWRETRCAGSIFRNIEPTSAAERRQAAGFFLEEAGARKLRVGKARLYEKHANIIVADSGCTARDVWELSEQMIEAVHNQFGITLIREVRFIGAFGISKS